MTSVVFLLLVPLCSLFPACAALDNGLARTPPMGWMSWTRFACETDCALFPQECINEELYKEMADMMADMGFAAAGYQYVNIDDCWSEKERDSVTNRLVPDKKRFPSGIPQLAGYVHAKGLKFGKLLLLLRNPNLENEARKIKHTLQQSFPGDQEFTVTSGQRRAPAIRATRKRADRRAKSRRTTLHLTRTRSPSGKWTPSKWMGATPTRLTSSGCIHLWEKR